MKILITGATGFLGMNLAKRLQKQGHEVIGLGRNQSAGEQLTQAGIKFIQCSLDQIGTIDTQMSGIECVVHSAAFSSPWGDKEVFEQANIKGTQNIVDLAIKYKTKRFIHISTPSLYFKFKDAYNILETDSIEEPHPSMYTHTKYFAEKIVDKAISQNQLNAITIRPRGIFGPGDVTLLPRIIKLAKERKLSQVGNSKNNVDITYVDNVSQAIELAIFAPDKYLGEKYNITNGEPIEQWEFIAELLSKLGHAPPTKIVPYKVAYFFAAFLEFSYKLFRIKSEPRLTRYTVGLLYFSQTLSIEKAKNELGYNPEVSIQEGLSRVVKWWRANEN